MGQEGKGYREEATAFSASMVLICLQFHPCIQHDVLLESNAVSITWPNQHILFSTLDSVQAWQC